MRDYEVLINALNAMSNKNSCYYCQGETLVCEAHGCILSNAADAIEELLAENKAIKQSNKDAAMRNKLLCDEISRMKEKVPKWVSVEERLPEKSEIVLVAYDNGVVAQGMLFFGKFRGANFGFDENDEPIIAEVTHWMPLPTPPKGVE